MGEPDIRSLGRELIDRFAEGWSRADIDTIMSVFHDEAVFIETPFSKPAVGKDAIRRWWIDVPYYQSEVRVTTGEIFGAGPWFSTEFKAIFRRRRTGERVDARGAIFCETGEEKVTEMRMYWHRRNDGSKAGGVT